MFSYRRFVDTLWTPVAKREQLSSAQKLCWRFGVCKGHAAFQHVIFCGSHCLCNGSARLVILLHDSRRHHAGHGTRRTAVSCAHSDRILGRFPFCRAPHGRVVIQYTRASRSTNPFVFPLVLRSSRCRNGRMTGSLDKKSHFSLFYTVYSRQTIHSRGLFDKG